MTTYKLNLDKRRYLNIPEGIKLVFLCGSTFRAEHPEDKRIALKRYLNEELDCRVVILEESFSDERQYGEIELRNLRDVEAITAYFADATIIIHESISTAAELGMFASNSRIASKLLVLYPDADSVEENKMSQFIDLAFFGTDPVLTRGQTVSFSAAISKSYRSNHHHVYHTKFPRDIKDLSHTSNSIKSFILETVTQGESKVAVEAAHMGRVRVDMERFINYIQTEMRTDIFLSPSILKTILLGLITLDSVVKKIESSSSYYGVIDVLDKELKSVLRATLSEDFGTVANEVSVILQGVELTVDTNTSDHRKAIGLFLYLLKATGYLSVLDAKRFKLTRQVSDIRNKYSSIVVPTHQTIFAKFLEENGVV